MVPVVVATFLFASWEIDVIPEATLVALDRTVIAHAAYAWRAKGWTLQSWQRTPHPDHHYDLTHRFSPDANNPAHAKVVLVLQGPVRVATAHVAFAMQVRLNWGGKDMAIDVIDTFAFDDAGKVKQITEWHMNIKPNKTEKFANEWNRKYGGPPAHLSFYYLRVNTQMYMLDRKSVV